MAAKLFRNFSPRSNSVSSLGKNLKLNSAQYPDISLHLIPLFSDRNSTAGRLVSCRGVGYRTRGIIVQFALTDKFVSSVQMIAPSVIGRFVLPRYLPSLSWQILTAWLPSATTRSTLQFEIQFQKKKERVFKYRVFPLFSVYVKVPLVYQLSKNFSNQASYSTKCRLSEYVQGKVVFDYPFKGAYPVQRQTEIFQMI